MNKWQAKVREFHRACGLDEELQGCFYERGFWRMLDYRCDFIDSELTETRDAVEAVDVPAFDDGLVDMLYFILGTADQMGIDLDPYFDAVHAANMAKKGGGLDENHKLRKPPGWTPPDIEGMVEQRVGFVGGAE